MDFQKLGGKWACFLNDHRRAYSYRKIMNFISFEREKIDLTSSFKTMKIDEIWKKRKTMKIDEIWKLMIILGHTENFTEIFFLKFHINFLKFHVNFFTEISRQFPLVQWFLINVHRFFNLNVCIFLVNLVKHTSYMIFS